MRCEEACPLYPRKRQQMRIPANGHGRFRKRTIISGMTVARGVRICRRHETLYQSLTGVCKNSTAALFHVEQYSSKALS
jgi:hypothetical protein